MKASSVKPDQHQLAMLEKIHLAVQPGPVLILTHDNPDPDALACGKALGVLLGQAWGIPSRLVYSGTVARADNRAMLRLLTPEWEHMDELVDLEAYAAIALVDSQPGAGNNRVPDTQKPVLAFDHHHPIRESVSSLAFAEIQPDVGATATLLHGYLEMAGIVPDPVLATALFYGLKTDTHGLSRGVSTADERAYIKLLSLLDYQLLIQVENAGLDRAHFRALHHGLAAAMLHGKVILARLGVMEWPDQGAEIADMLIRFEDAQAVLCQGVHENRLYLSLRTKQMEEDAGELIQRVIVTPGRAGGHGSMAGGQVPLEGAQPEQVMASIEQRFLSAMNEDMPGEALL